jgi:hypothetical protein
LGGWQFEASPGRKLVRPYLNKKVGVAGYPWLTTVILAGWKAEIRIAVQSQLRNSLKNTQYKKGLVQWLKWWSACLASV